jgi:hypothetical protein
MSATMELPRLFTIGEVKRQLQADGLGRSETAIRRLEDRGVVKPFRAVGQHRRLYTEADVPRPMCRRFRPPFATATRRSTRPS